MRLFFSFCLFFILIFSVITACRKDTGHVNFGDYPVGIGSIIVNTCATKGCHDATSAPASSGLNLSTWKDLFSGSNSGSPVIPYSSKFSSLCYAINTYPDLGPSTEPAMPLNQTPLSHDQVKQIENWVDAGAPDIKGNVMWSEAGRKKLYAVNQGCDVVTVFDSESQLPIRYIEVGRPGIPDTPHQLRISPDGKYWYVIFINYNVMEKYSCDDDKKIGNIPLTPLAAGTGTFDQVNWNTFNLSSDGKNAYCVSYYNSGFVVSVDLVNMKLLHFLVLQGSTHGIAIAPDKASIFVSYQNGNAITQIDTAFSSYNDISLNANSVSYSDMSLQPHDMLVSPSGTELLITCQGSNDIRILRLSDYSVTAVVSAGTGTVQEIIESPASGKYYVSCFDPAAGGKVLKMDPANYSITTLTVGCQPHGICTDEKKKLIYVLSRNIACSGGAPHHTSQCAGRNGFVNFIDLNTFTLQSKKYEMSVDPYFIAARP